MTGQEWVAAFAAELGTQAPDDTAMARLLDLAGVAAHTSERLAGPLACYLAGAAGIEAGAALAAARSLSARSGETAGSATGR
jgi:hypothetical protein